MIAGMRWLSRVCVCGRVGVVGVAGVVVVVAVVTVADVAIVWVRCGYNADNNTNITTQIPTTYATFPHVLSLLVVVVLRLVLTGVLGL